MTSSASIQRATKRGSNVCPRIERELRECHPEVECRPVGVMSAGQSVLMLSNVYTLQANDIDIIDGVLHQAGCVRWNWILPEGGGGDVRIVVDWNDSNAWAYYVILVIVLGTVYWYS